VLKSRLKITYVLLFISIIILGAAFMYTGRLPEAYAAFKDRNDVRKASKQLFEAYNVMDNTFHFELPDSWHTNEVSFAGGEILYHMSFASQDGSIHGFVQVWKLSEPLKKFVEKSKKSAVGVVDFKYFDIREIMLDNKKGYLLDYSRANSKGEYTKAYEAFIEGYSNKVYRLSFFVPEKEWRNYYKVLFDRIIHTAKIYK
jgi:hypothetical protein